MESWKISIVNVGYKFERNVYIFRGLPNGKIEILGVGEIERGDEPTKPTLELNTQQLQEFANALADVGINPKEGYEKGKLEATEKHLQDLRKMLKLK